MILRISWLLARPGRAGVATLALPVIAFATVTALLLVVIGGAQKFWGWSDDDGFIYQFLAVIALVLLVVPLSSLGGAAARLSARRRDDRLATLRLLGATPATVTAITVLESTVLAVLGALGGVLLYLAAVPLVGLIHFRGEPLGAGSVLLPPLLVLAVVAGVALLATVSAVLALRRVLISPLGVRMRDDAPKEHWIRAVIAVVVIAATYGVMGVIGAGFPLAVMLTVIAVGFGGTLAVLGLVGPWVVRIMGRVQLRRAKTPARLIAARGILESPKEAWRQVSGVAMTSFMAVFAGTGVGVMTALSGGATEDLELLYDIQTGVLITVIGSFLMVACSVGVNQAASILDRRDIYESLSKLGMPVETMEGARRRTVMAPLLLTSLGSAGVSAIVLFPLAGAALIFAPSSVLVILGVLAAGIALVWLGLFATRPVLTRAARLA
ncbi:FtsX-like permease family protein [Glaciihabitans arcticus]|uniref:FtsX-like permease family protein n=1 Tax=Glaciihabitans arcticus TaxID=2668039 RepID=A0A4V2JEQ6_9MICO|nr:FtsX-like permease family protein [Glaciihabitans arcticus]TBN56439.1 FtsX-like permease family protein [Glaciihabitans arcticus]